MKYTIELIKRGDHPGVLNVAVFSEGISHCDIPRHKEGRIVGAGFCHVDEDGVHTHGHSESLKVQPHQADSIILGFFLTNQFEQQRVMLAALYEED